jgi:hypothetical protein
MPRSLWTFSLPESKKQVKTPLCKRLFVVTPRSHKSAVLTSNPTEGMSDKQSPSEAELPLMKSPVSYRMRGQTKNAKPTAAIAAPLKTSP